MKSALGREQYLSIALAVAVALLTGLLLWEWDQGVQMERALLKMRNIPVVAVKPLNVLPEFSLPPEDSGFPELISRSLFSINRHSTAGRAKGGATSMKRGQFVLVGVFITPQQTSALLRDVQTNKNEAIALNGVVRGMTVGEVQSGRVLLRQGAETEELTLNIQTGPKSPATPRVVAVPPQAPVAAPLATPPSAAPATAPVPARAASSTMAPASAPGSSAALKPGEVVPPVHQTPSSAPRADAKKQQ